MKARLMCSACLSVGTLCLLLAATQADASILSLSATAPTVDGADIANLGGAIVSATGENPNLGGLWDYVNRPAQGETFTTGSNAGGYTFNAVTLLSTNDIVFPHVPFNVYVSSVSGTTATQIVADPSSNNVNIGVGDYITVTFAAPIHLNPNSVYAVDWEALWGGSLPEGNSGRGTNLAHTEGNAYADGSVYLRYEHAVTQSPDWPPMNHDAAPTVLELHPNYDLAFHLDMTAVPEPSTLTLLASGVAGLLCYAWRRRK